MHNSSTGGVGETRGSHAMSEVRRPGRRPGVRSPKRATPPADQHDRRRLTATGSGVPEMRKPTALREVDLPTVARPTRNNDWQPSYTATTVVLDLLAGLGAAALAFAVRFGGTAPWLYLAASLAMAPLWVLLVTMSRAYEHRFIGVGTEEVRRVVHAGVTLMALVSFGSYAAKAELSRGYVMLAIPSVVLFSVLARCAQRAWLHSRRAHGRCVQRTVLVGSAAAVRQTIQRLHADSSHGMSIVGACVTQGDPGDVTELGVIAYGDLHDIEAAVRASEAGAVTVLSSALLSGVELRRLAWRLEPLGATLVVCSGLTEISGARVTIRPTAHSPMLHVASARLSGPSRIVKGAFDRTWAVLGLAVIAPALLLIALGIFAHDGKSPFFRQTRVGRKGQEFRIFKFRTMGTDAELRKAALIEAQGHSALLFKLAEDPRVTPIGRWLRRYSIDELPQLINVVRGEMSLVGPRPQVPAEVAEYGSDYRRRLLVKPGLTGLWQVSGRSQLTPAESELLDLRYVENWSFGFDLLILWRTARAVLCGSGAY